MKQLVVVIAIAACGGGLEGEPALGGDGLEVAVVDSVELPVIGASVCYLDGTSCATVGADGIAVMPVAPDAFALVGRKAGYHGTLLLESAATQVGVMRLATDAEALARYGDAFPYPDDANGFLELDVDTADTVVDIVGHLRPVYADAHGVLDPSLTRTTTSGRVVFGNLPPGTYELTAIHDGAHCTAGTGHNGAPLGAAWPPTQGGDLAFAIAASATTTTVSMACP